jgi:STAS domain-containing protein
MPACSLEREVIGNTALYRVTGKFEAPSAWELSGRFQQDPLGDVVVDFSQVSEFADYGVAIIAGALVGSRKHIELRGLRQHQERLFGYFGVDPVELARPRRPVSSALEPLPQGATKEVA